MTRTNMFYWQSDRPYSVEEIKTIFLARKDDYSPEQMINAAEHAAGEKIAELYEPINHGSVNIVCPFRTQSGREGVVRAHPRQVKNEYFFAEREAMRVAKAAGVPVPDTWLVDDSRSIAPFDYMVMERVSGQVLKEVAEKDSTSHPSYLRQIGEKLAKLHSVQTEGYGFFDNERARRGVLTGIYQSNQDHYLAALDLDEQFHQENSIHIDSQLTKKAIDMLRKKVDLSICNQPTIVHNDIADWNTIVDQGRVTGVMDWDECFSGDPIFDFATMSLFYTDKQMQFIKDGYGTLPDGYNDKFDLYVIRYVISKSKIAIKQLNSRQNDFMQKWLSNATKKLEESIKRLT